MKGQIFKFGFSGLLIKSQFMTALGCGLAPVQVLVLDLLPAAFVQSSGQSVVQKRPFSMKQSW